MKNRFTAEEAAAALGVSVGTLYAYVSRGLLRSEPVPGTRRHSYSAADVQRLKDRKEARRDPSKAAGRSLHFGGLPVLPSSLTLIRDGKLFYRGRDAVAWAEDATVEETAELLWDAPFPDEVPRGPLNTPLGAEILRLEADDPLAHDLRPEGVRRAGAAILRLAASHALVYPPNSDPIDRQFRHAWVTRGGDILRRALVLCADHELNVSAFTARCVASAGASPYAAVAGALCAFSGSKHGGHGVLVGALFDEVVQGRPAADALGARLRRGQPIPGFGHPLYPEGDPRARALLDALDPPKRVGRVIDAIAETAMKELDLLPNVDFALTAVARALKLPQDAPYLLFAVGRTVGWIAHAIEQYAADRMIRPRARYVGP